MKNSKEAQHIAGSCSLLPKLTFSTIVAKLKKPVNKFFKSTSDLDSYLNNISGNKFQGSRINESIILKQISAMKDRKSSTSQSYQNLHCLRKRRLKKILNDRYSSKPTQKPRTFCCSVTGKNICNSSFDELNRYQTSVSSTKEIVPSRIEHLNKVKFKLPRINLGNSSKSSQLLNLSYLPSVTLKKPKRISKEKLISPDTSGSINPPVLPIQIILKKKPEISIPEFKHKTLRTSLPFTIKMKRPDSRKSEYPSPLSPFGHGNRDTDDSFERTLQFSVKNNSSLF